MGQRLDCIPPKKKGGPARTENICGLPSEKFLILPGLFYSTMMYTFHIHLLHDAKPSCLEQTTPSKPSTGLAKSRCTLTKVPFSYSRQKIHQPEDADPSYHGTWKRKCTSCEHNYFRWTQHNKEFFFLSSFFFFFFFA